jgi:hypothetical protein
MGFLSQQLSMGESLERKLTDDIEWRWARNEDNLGELQRAAAAVRSQMTDFDQAVTVTDTTYLRGKFTPERLAVNLDAFMGLKQEVDNLTDKISALVRMQKGRQEKTRLTNTRWARWQTRTQRHAVR